MITERKLWELISQYQSFSKICKLKGTFPTNENIMQCFGLFENILDFMGAFKEIMTEIKNDLTEAIFSYVLTTNELEKIQRITYFTLYTNSLELNTSNSLKFEKLQESLIEKNMELERNFNVLQNNFLVKEKDCFQHQEEQMLLMNKIEQLQNQLNSIQNENLQIQISNQNTIDTMTIELNSLKKEIIQKNSDIKDLYYFKEVNDHLDKSFMQACQNYEDENFTEIAVAFNKKANLEMEIKSIGTMENDLEILENLMLDDFEKRMIEFKQRLMSRRFINNDDLDKSYLKDFDEDQFIANSVIEFNNAKLYFKNEFSQIQIEFLMLQNHQAALINDWALIQESEMKSDTDVIKDIRTNFIINNQIMNKYSAIIYISNDGNTFYECKETRFCESCGNKSVFCPHNLQKEKVIKLPNGSTHIKIQRPVIKIYSKYAKFFTKNYLTITEDKNEIAPNEERKLSSRKSFRSSVSSNDSETFIPFETLLEDFENRTQIKRISLRKFNEVQILSTIEDFWATILYEDEYGSQLLEITTLLDKLYLFFLERYAHEKAAMLALYDFLVNIIDLASVSQFIQLFCHVLIANIDSSVMRYLFHLVDCISMVTWKNEEDFRYFLAIVYPFLNDDDIDSVVLSYISYSENVFEESRIFEYLVSNLLKQRDPRFNWIKSEAVELKTTTAGFYTLSEFQILLESLTSFPNKKLSIRLFKELSVFYTEEGFKEIAPLSKISEIVAFLSFFESVEKVKHTLCEKYTLENKKNIELLNWGFTKLMHSANNLLRET